jgi:hypothetical protein
MLVACYVSMVLQGMFGVLWLAVLGSRNFLYLWIHRKARGIDVMVGLLCVVVFT